MKTNSKISSVLILTALAISPSLFSQSNDHKIDSTTFRNLIFSHQFKTDTVSSKYTADLIDKLSELYLVSGTVRFSGTAAPRVASTELKNTSLKATSTYLHRLQSGSRITFEKTIFRKIDSTSSFPVNKSIFIQ